MSEVIEQNKNNPSVAFAHSVSADFHHKRHMSAGAAVTFRQKFGRPHYTDLVARNLACQRVHHGSTVYSLLTKANFYGKPTIETYDAAFDQLLLDFRSQGLKTLFCTAIGCVRDLIEPQHFMNNMAKFQKATGANVYVVSYDQVTAKRPLWKGKSHQEFITTLQKLANKHVSPLIREQSTDPLKTPGFPQPSSTSWQQSHVISRPSTRPISPPVHLGNSLTSSAVHLQDLSAHQ